MANLGFNLEDAVTVKRLENLIKGIDQSDNTRAAFIKDPVGQVMKKVLPDHKPLIENQRLVDANEVLFSMVGKKKFITRMAGIQKKIEKEIKINNTIPDRDKILKDISAAIIAEGDATILKNFLQATDRSLPSTAGWVTNEIVIVTAAVVALVVVITAIDFTPKVDPNFGENFISPSDLTALTRELVKQAKIRNG